MAVSAAFPGIIGPFVIDTKIYEWRKRKEWNIPKDAEEIKAPPFDKLHLYDGGIYDNLGTEPLFDCGKQCQKDGVDFILVSDAGAPPLRLIGPSRFRPYRLKRVADIMSDQTRSFRVRSFANFLQHNPEGGVYIRIGAHAEEKLRSYCGHNLAAAEVLVSDTWSSADNIARAAAYPTTLRRMSRPDFDLLARHGYETVKWNIGLFCRTSDFSNVAN